jgi:hydroxymethylglutaryl-CoA reductase (NADPH)
VIAEAVLKREPTQRLLGVTLQQLTRAREIQDVGHFMAGSSHCGANTASGLAGLFIATGQDVANLAESHTGIVYTRPLDNGDLYWSLTLPSLIVGTYGSGTSLPTQREALAMLGCYGKDKANKFAEICAALALAGELSASAALVAGDAPAQDKYARNRP